MNLKHWFPRLRHNLVIIIEVKIFKSNKPVFVQLDEFFREKEFFFFILYIEFSNNIYN